MFCALCVEVGKAYDDPLHLLSRRMVSHGSASDVFNKIVNRYESGKHTFIWLPDRPSCDPDLYRFARSFLLLRDERERADYDHDWAPTKKDAEDAVILAKDAISQLQQARDRSSNQVSLVCLAVMVDQRSRRRIKL